MEQLSTKPKPYWLVHSFKWSIPIKKHKCRFNSIKLIEIRIYQNNLDTSLDDIIFLNELTWDFLLPALRPCCSCRYVLRCSLARTNQRCTRSRAVSTCSYEQGNLDTNCKTGTNRKIPAALPAVGMNWLHVWRIGYRSWPRAHDPVQVNVILSVKKYYLIFFFFFKNVHKFFVYCSVLGIFWGTFWHY